MSLSLNKEAILESVKQAGFIKCVRCGCWYLTGELHYCYKKDEPKKKTGGRPATTKRVQVKKGKYVVKRTNKDKVLFQYPIKDKATIEKIKLFIRASFPHKTAVRNLCYFIFGINTGLRGRDILNIRIEEMGLPIDQEGNFIIQEGHSFPIREGKTGKRRDIYINAAMAEILNEWLELRRHHDGYLVCSVRNTAQMKPGYFQKTLKEIGEALGIELSVRIMRKTWARAVFDANVDIEIISQCLNHSSTAITRRYIGLDRDDLRVAFDICL